MNKERLEHGAAVIKGTLGGARAHASLAAMIAAIDNCYQTGNDIAAYSDDMVLAIADIDSELERAATDRGRLARATANLTDCNNRLMAESERAESLQARNDNQAATITAFEQRHAEAVSAGAEVDRELEETRESLKGMATNRDEWRKRAREAEADCELARRQRNAEIDRTNKAEAALSRLMTELGGLTLAKLPSAALAAAYVDIREGR